MERKGHKFKDCPKLKPPREISETIMDFCIECMIRHPPGECICKLCKTIGHIATECPWLEETETSAKSPELDERDEEPEVLFCLHCRSEAHRIEDCTAHKVAQAKRRRVWCEKCKQYGHTIAECLDEKQEQRSKEIEKEILKKKTTIRRNRKMQQVKRQAEKDIGKPPQDRDTREYPMRGRKPTTKPKESNREPEPPSPPREGLPSGPPVGGAEGGEPPEGDDPSDPDDSESDESDEEESDGTEATEESGFLYDEKGRKIDIAQFHEAIRKRKKRTTKA